MKDAPANRTFPPPDAEPHLIGYARVSTRDQDPQMQIDALLKAGVHQDDIFYETVSGAAKRRPQFDAMMKDARDGDVIVFWKLDRLGRSVRQVLDSIAKLDAKGARIKCLTQPIDTTTPLGRLILVILAAVAEMERELGLERTRAGLERARSEGRRGGSTPKHEHDAILEFAKLGSALAPALRACRCRVSSRPWRVPANGSQRRRSHAVQSDNAKPETTEMPRTLEQWRNMIPNAVCDGSPAQILYCVTDARTTILAQANELSRLRVALSLQATPFILKTPQEKEINWERVMREVNRRQKLAKDALS